ncbi:ABC transporter permease [Dinghuibacter silviterrae]|uniref:ABC-type antimicrobial peptide transport system permease subunit n=1 Tax=Dinghuibacter silviterrae TaxID=1539049 RepID=A0A4R8DVA2_9BACT|nr:FtsX-like permease family protein [Dinghuibacter silviterrae]TDX01936.1 ABC-type antimicrobial peptide transport system permease subunit [Dinghuibacter silviterrae]
MLLSYIKIAWRTLRKERLFTLLNLAGLSTGLACALLIWLWIADERGKDHGNPKDAQLYQVMQNLKEDGRYTTMSYTSGLLAAGLKADFPQVEYAATVIPASWFGDMGMGLLTVGDTLLKASGQFVSKDYFAIFRTPFVAGDAHGVMTDMHSIAMSEKLAREIYGSPQNALNKSIRWNQGQFDGTYLITGVFEDRPTSDTDPFDILLNFDLFGKKRPGIVTDWGNSDPSTFVRLKPGTDTAQFNALIANYVQKRQTYKEDKVLFVRRFSDRYLHDQYTDGHLSGGRIIYVRLFSLIAVFILALACINFMNLSTARASRRLKEVGIKKVVGARRSSLVLQYLGESVLMSFLALGLALALVSVFLPAFNSLTGKTLGLGWAVTVPAAVVALATGLFAGSYPALYLSGFTPIATLKGSLHTIPAELWVRKGLVVFQFVLSVSAIVGVLVIYRQLHYIQTRDLGYSRDHVIDFPVPVSDSLSERHAISFLNEVQNLPGVVSAGSHHHDFNGGHGGIGGFDWPGKKPGQELTFANLEVGTGFMRTMGIRMKEGRYMSDDSSAHNEIVFNEAAIRFMGLKHPIGQTITFWGMHKQIVGVAEDFNFESLYKTIEPAFFQVYSITDNIVIKIRAGSEHQVIEQVGSMYSRFYKGLSFDYRFLDDEYAKLYAAENRVSLLSRYFAGLAILISCLGLFGLAAFTAQRRQKEIGIRKVIGASVTRIALMLSRDFFRLVAIATLVAFPLTWWAMNRWLEAFAYRIRIGGDIFLISGGAIMGITLLTIGFQAVKAGRANPVNSLRSE